MGPTAQDSLTQTGLGRMGWKGPQSLLSFSRILKKNTEECPPLTSLVIPRPHPQDRCSLGSICSKFIWNRCT
jgi:hypothetical protein